MAFEARARAIAAALSENNLPKEAAARAKGTVCCHLLRCLLADAYGCCWLYASSLLSAEVDT